MTQQLSIWTGCSAGATESFVVVPFELVKVKYVAQIPREIYINHRPPPSLYRLQDKTSSFAGPTDVVKQIVKKDGLLGLYAGMEATFWR